MKKMLLFAFLFVFSFAVVSAVVGCSDADLDGNGHVDAADAAIVTAKVGDVDCNSINLYCDGADVDKDGNVTAADVALVQAKDGVPCIVPIFPPIPAPVIISCTDADLDGNGHVDAADVAIVTSKVGDVDCNSTNLYCDGADLDKDGDVTAADVALVQAKDGVACIVPIFPHSIVVDLISPADGFSVESDSYDAIFMFNATGSNDLANCELFLDDVSIANITGLVNVINFTFSDLIPGDYAWYVECTDDKTNVNVSESRSFSVTAPKKTIKTSSGGSSGGKPTMCPDGSHFESGDTLKCIKDILEEANISLEDLNVSESDFNKLSEVEQRNLLQRLLDLITGNVTGGQATGIGAALIFILLAITAFIVVKKKKAKK